MTAVVDALDTHRSPDQCGRTGLAERAACWLPGPPAGAMAAAGGLALLTLGALLDVAFLVLLGLVAATTGLLRRWLPVDLAVPAAALALLVVTIALGVPAGPIGIDLLGAPRALLAGYLAGAAGVLALSLARPAPPRRALQRHGLHGADWLALAPAALTLGIALVQGVSIGVVKSWAMISTDLPRHLILLRTVQESGALSYDESAYPRALHLLSALASVPRPPLADSVALLGYDARLYSALTWATLALLSWTAAVLVIRAGRPAGLPHIVCLGAAALVGTGLLLSNVFVQNFLFMGAAPSLLAVVVAWALPLAAVARPRRRLPLPILVVVTAAAALLLSHLWQALAIAPVVAFLACLAPQLRTMPADLRTARPGELLGATVFGLLAVALTLPPMTAALGAGGTGLAGLAGSFPLPPWQPMAVAAALSVPLLRRLTGSFALLMLGSVLGLFAATGLLVAGAGNGLDLTAYYPAKMVWFTVLVCSPLLAAGVVLVAYRCARATWMLLGRAGRATSVLRAVTVAFVVAALLSVGLPWALGWGGHTALAVRRSADSSLGKPVPRDTLSANRYDIASRYGGRYPGRIVIAHYVGYDAVLDGYGTPIVSGLLSFQSGAPEVLSDREPVCDKIARLAGDRESVVITKLAASLVDRELATGGCAGQAEVVHLPGGISNAGFLDP